MVDGVDGSAPDLTLIVLAFNEEKTVGSYVADCLAFLDTVPGRHEVIVVDDGSSDATLARAKEAAANDRRVRVFSHGRNLGMGAGMRTGIRYARGQYFVILAADGQVRAWELQKMLPVLRPGGMVSTVYANRPPSVARTVLSTGLRGLFRLLFRVSFKLEGIYLFPVALAREEIGLDVIRSETFFFTFELITRALQRGVAIDVVPIDCLPRAEGASKVVTPRRIARVAEELLKFRLRLWQEGQGPKRSS
jgi:glycosyltransferase involved in cell wall biosynthesis